MCSGETETETETGTTAANNCRKRTQRAGRPEIRDSPNIAIGFCSRSHSDSDSPSLALCRTSALSIALSQNRARVVRATSGSAHAQCSRCSCCSSCLHSWLSLSLSLSGCLCRGNFAPTRISNCALFMFLMDVSLILVALSEAMIHMYKQLHTQ